MLKATLPAEGAWKGQAAWIVGGGPSLKTFPWHRLIPKRNIIAINMAFRNALWADIFFTEDLRVINELIPAKEELRQAWERFQGVKVFHCLDESYKAPALTACSDLHIIERKHRDKFWSKSWEEGLSYSSNSAIGAINIATILDAEPIYLLGIDCRRTKEEANYHDHYPADWRMPEGQDKSFASDFTHWAALHTKNRAVINLINPDFPSALECWPKVPWGEAL